MHSKLGPSLRETETIPNQYSGSPFFSVRSGKSGSLLPTRRAEKKKSGSLLRKTDDSRASPRLSTHQVISSGSKFVTVLKPGTGSTSRAPPTAVRRSGSVLHCIWPQSWVRPGTESTMDKKSKEVVNRSSNISRVSREKMQYLYAKVGLATAETEPSEVSYVKI